MKVRELIEVLKGFDQELPVLKADGDYTIEVSGIQRLTSGFYTVFPESVPEGKSFYDLITTVDVEEAVVIT